MLNITNFSQTGMIVILVIFCAKMHIWSCVVHLKLPMFVDIKLQVVIVAPYGQSLRSWHAQIWQDKDVNCNLTLVHRAMQLWGSNSGLKLMQADSSSMCLLCSPHSNEVELIPITHRLAQVGTACLTKTFSLTLSHQNKTEFCQQYQMICVRYIYLAHDAFTFLIS